MWTKWARLQVKSARALVATRLHEEEKAESVEKVHGGCSTRPAGDVAWLPGLHLAPNRPLLVGGDLIHPYKYPLPVKVDTPHSTCSSSLVKILV
jgi:hypothetical protein